MNPLDHPIVFRPPRRVTAMSTWREHIPFALLAIDLLRPESFVELGTHWGDSYCAFCQAAQELGTGTRCYAIDHWRGDPQTGFYGPEVLADLRDHHDPLYGSFSRLVESDFDDAVGRFSDGSIDLLHIDGFHEYDVVRHDFETWLPKLSRRGVVLLHDTNFRDPGYEVWRLWEELRAHFRSFEFPHSHGLGIAAVGDRLPEPFAAFLTAAESRPAGVAAFFATVGKSIPLQRERDEQLRRAAELGAAVERLDRELRETREESAELEEDLKAERQRRSRDQDRLEGVIESLQARRAGMEEEVRELHVRLRERERAEEHLHALLRTKTFRYSAPARAVYSRLRELHAAGGRLETPDLDGDSARPELHFRDLLRGERRTVLVVSPDLVPLPGLPAVGSGLRAWALGEGLRDAGHDVVFSLPRPALERFADRVPLDVLEASWELCNIDEVVDRVVPDIVVVSGWANVGQLAQDLRSRMPLVVDQHGPHILEREHQGYGDRESNVEEKLAALRRADFFTAAGSRQLQYFKVWLQLAGWSEHDREERAAAIPVSLSPELPARAPQGGPTFVYGGVFLPWQDPARSLLTLVDELERRRAGRLELFGGKHPWIPVPTGVFDELVQRLEQSRHVRVHATVPHDALIARYTGAHVAIDLMRRNAERELAFTTRTVEYLWCGLPVIYNDYAELADYIADYDAGWVVDPDDERTLRDVIAEIFDAPGRVEEKSRNAQRLVAERLSWDLTIGPLDAFLRAPSFRERADGGDLRARGVEIAAAR